MTEVNETLKFEITEMRQKLQIEVLEQRVSDYLEKNQIIYEEKARIMHDLESASRYIMELETKIYQ